MVSLAVSLQVLNLRTGSHSSQKLWSSVIHFWHVLISYKFIKNGFCSEGLINITQSSKQHEFWPLSYLPLFSLLQRKVCCIFKTAIPEANGSQFLKKKLTNDKMSCNSYDTTSSLRFMFNLDKIYFLTFMHRCLLKLYNINVNILMH